MQTVKLFLNFCFQSLLKTAADCCQTEHQIQWDALGSMHTARVAEHVWMRTLHRRL